MAKYQETELEKKIEIIVSKGAQLIEQKVKESEPKISKALSRFEKWLDSKLS